MNYNLMKDNIESENEFKLPIIKTYDELEKYVDELYDQGFGYIGRTYTLHENKISKIISKANTLNLETPSEITSKFLKIRNYDDAEKEANNYFSKYSTTDKIDEILSNSFSIVADGKCKAPEENTSNIKEVIEWVTFKKKYNLNDNDFRFYHYNISYYDMDKKYIKINFGNDYDDFKTLYNMIYKEECLKWERKVIGEWTNLGKIEIKLFQNNTANIRGDIDFFKNYFYKSLKSKIRHYGRDIIKYNNKVEILKEQS